MLALNIIPAHVEHLTIRTISSIYDRFGTDLDSTETSLSKKLPCGKHIGPEVKRTLVPSQKHYTIHHHTQKCFYVIKVLQLFLLTLISAPSVEQFNSSLRFVRNRMRSSMGEDRFNDLMLLHKQKDIELDIEEIFDTFAKKHPRKMLLLIHCLSCFACLLYFLKKLYALLFCKNESQFT